MKALKIQKTEIAFTEIDFTGSQFETSGLYENPEGNLFLVIKGENLVFSFTPNQFKELLNDSGINTKEESNQQNPKTVDQDFVLKLVALTKSSTKVEPINMKFDE